MYIPLEFRKKMKFLEKTHIKILSRARDLCARNYRALGLKNQDSKNDICHVPVMKEQVCEYLNLKDGDTVLDMTFGGGGHTKFLLEKYSNLKVIALDRDPVAVTIAKDLQKKLPEQIVPLLGKFSELIELAEANNICMESVDGVLFDLGTSAMQMDIANRGFAVSQEGPLDMRMDGDRIPNSINAADIVNYASEHDLYKIFKIYGDEKHAKLIARSIIQIRVTYQKFRTTKDLANLVEMACSRTRLDKLQRKAHSATKVFQALRIFVNNELNELNHGLLLANKFLKPGGRAVVISFHSLEDTIVKRHFQGHIFDNTKSLVAPYLKNQSWCVTSEVEKFDKKPWRPINTKVIVPTKEEVELNPRSRSAKLRSGEKICNAEK